MAAQHGGIHFDWGVFVYAALITILTALLFGLAPAWTATNTEAAGSLQESSHSSTRRHRASGGRAIVIFQIALSTLLVVAAGLFLRTVYALSSVDLGFRPDHVLLFEINPPAQRYPQEKEVQLRSQLERAFSSVPGVQSETFMSVPYIADYTLTTFFETEEEAAVQRRRKGERVTDVGNNFFQTLGIPIVAGRNFGPQDTATSPEVAILNQSLARSRFPHGNPVGKRLKFGIPLKDEWVQVVGICDDTRYANLRDNAPAQFFVPYVQRSEEGGGTYAVRTPLQPSMIVPTLRRVVQQADPDLPIVNIRTQREQIDDSMRMERTFAALTTGFGVLALALACVGVFGVMAYSVAQRTNEIGIRMALGAQPGQVKGMILCESTLLAADRHFRRDSRGAFALATREFHALRDPTLRSGIDGSWHSYPAGGCPSRKLDSGASSSWSAADGRSQTRVTVNRKSSLQFSPTGQRAHPHGLKIKIAGSGRMVAYPARTAVSGVTPDGR